MRAEEALRKSQKVEAMGQLTGGVAHDFNNLLTVIRGSVDLLRRSDLPKERRRRYIDAIADTADRATRLTRQLLAFARRQTLRFETFDASAELVGLADMLRILIGPQIRLEIESTGEARPVSTDGSQFDTDVVKIAVNARDAMQGEGRLSISVGHADRIPAVRNHPAVKGARVTVAISNTGSRIGTGAIDRIFEPFYTTKDVGEGTGLGLSQVFGFVTQAGGDILVESREGEGSTFTLYLPAAAATDTVAAAPAATQPAASGDGSCILVVEDNVQVGRFATEALSALGYETVLVIDAARALAEIAAAPDHFDMVFTDVVMPGISGLELAQRVRRLRPGLPVVLTSDYSTVLAEQGTHGFELLRKSYPMDELATAVGKARRAGPASPTTD